jgi:dTDP-4-dehydrorhamnose 3,5-epimerase
MTMEIRKPTVCTEGAERANAMAQELGEPVLCPISVFADDRGWSLMNQLKGVMTPAGQINFSCQHPGVVKAWHRHKKQTDFWMCVQGHIKAGVWRDGESWAWMAVLGEMSPAVLVIPPGLWHGAATVGSVPAGLLYYVTHAYDPANPDEERLSYDAAVGYPWSVRHG